MSWLCKLACGIGTLLRNVFYLKGIEFWNTTNMKRLQYEMEIFLMNCISKWLGDDLNLWVKKNVMILDTLGGRTMSLNQIKSSLAK